MTLPKANGDNKPTQSEIKSSVTENVTERKYIMTNYTNITVKENLYHRTDKEVTCIEFKLNNSLEKESFTKLLSNLKTAFKGSPVKVYYSKVIFEFDESGNFVPDEKRKGFNKSHGGFLIETGTNFDKPACEKALAALAY